MVRRHLDSDFVGGAYVFPGGKVDEQDRGLAAARVCTGRSDEEASEILGVDSGGLAFWVAALRECFEEAGVLLAYGEHMDFSDEPRNPGDHETPPGSIMIDATDPSFLQRLAARRVQLGKGEVDFPGLCKAEGLSLAVDQVYYFSHWIAPEQAPKRYDTRFFVAALPPGQIPAHDDHETVDTVWVRPVDALERSRAGGFDLIFPTMKNLQAIGRFGTSGELLKAAAAMDEVPTVVPRVLSDEGGFRILVPGDPGYEEATRSAPAAAGDAQERAASGPSNVDIGEIIRNVGIDGRTVRRR